MKLQYADNNTLLGFQRLRINDTSQNGDQPFKKDGVFVIANAQIYNYKELKEEHKFEFKSESDCEILLHLYLKFRDVNKFVGDLDGVFSFAIHDTTTNTTSICRDQHGVRPLFMGLTYLNDIIFASEAKALINLCDNKTIQQFKPGNTWVKDAKYIIQKEWYELKENQIEKLKINQEYYYKETYDLLCKSIEKRMLSDRQIGAFLSGGLDSSIVCAIIQKYYNEQNKGKKLKTFSIGLKDSIDMKYAKILANYIGTDHTSVEITVEDCINALEDVIYTIESFDVTTIRASVPMYLLSKYISENTDIKVLFSGEGADEVAQGYLYFKNQPDSKSGSIESARLINDLHKYDLLRVDRTTASWGLEIREPFLDKYFVDHYQKLYANIKAPQNNIEKFYLRSVIQFNNPTLLPKSILWRQKEAFSDGISGLNDDSWVNQLKIYANTIYSNHEFQLLKKTYYPEPQQKDALLLRQIYDKYYGLIKPPLIDYYWIPKWSQQINPDSSARFLSIYSLKTTYNS